jgi:Zinc finger, C3HC4 type (RING finger)
MQSLLMRETFRGAFHVACRCGCLRAAEWAARRCAPTAAGVRAGDNRLVRQVCALGHGDVAVWLVEHFALTARDVCGEDCEPLWAACRNGHLGVAQWLADRFALSGATTRAPPSLLRDLCRSGLTETAQWAADRFALTAADARANDNEALREACARADLETAQWLVERFALSAGEVLSMAPAAVEGMRLHENPSVFHWILSRYPLPIEAAPAVENILPDASAQVFASAACVVCLDGRPEAVAVPCGHACMCRACATRVGRKCPVCRAHMSRLFAFDAASQRPE